MYIHIIYTHIHPYTHTHTHMLDTCIRIRILCSCMLYRYCRHRFVVWAKHNRCAGTLNSCEMTVNVPTRNAAISFMSVLFGLWKCGFRFNPTPYAMWCFATMRWCWWITDWIQVVKSSLTKVRDVFLVQHRDATWTELQYLFILKPANDSLDLGRMENHENCNGSTSIWFQQTTNQIYS